MGVSGNLCLEFLDLVSGFSKSFIQFDLWLRAGEKWNSYYLAAGHLLVFIWLKFMINRS